MLFLRLRRSNKRYKSNTTRHFSKSRSVFRTHIICVTDKDAPPLTQRKFSYLAVIKRKRTKDDNKCYIEKEGRNLNHNEKCLRSNANCPGITTVRSNFMQRVQALHPILLNTTGKKVSKTLAKKEGMNVRPKQDKVVLNMCNGNTKN
ncbi:unnamed protein product [Bathycoccus prasinos]